MKRIFVTLGLLYLVSACSMFPKLGNSDNLEPPAELVEISTQLQPTKLWSHKGGTGAGKLILGLRLAFQKGQLFVADHDGKVEAIDAESGRTDWRIDLDLPISAGPTVAEKVVVVGTLDGHVVVLNQSSGAVRWRTEVSSEILAGAAISSDRVVVRSQDGRVFGLDLATGERKWVYDSTVPLLTIRGNGMPLVRAGTVAIGFDSGKVVALRAEDGKLLWEENVATPGGRTELERMVDVDGNIAIVATDLYAASHNGRVVSMALASGQVLWAREMSAARGVSVDRTSLYLSDDEGKVHSIDRRNGVDQWTQDALLRRELTVPVSVGKYLVVGDFEGYLHWMDAESGRFVARQQVSGGAINATPVVAEERLYVMSRDGSIAAFALP